MRREIRTQEFQINIKLDWFRMQRGTLCQLIIYVPNISLDIQQTDPY